MNSENQNMTRQNNVELRRAVLAERAALDPETHHQKSTQICEALLQLEVWQQAEAVLFFLPFRQEVDIAPLLPLAWQMGKRVLAPRCLKDGYQLKISQISAMDQLVSGTWGIREPDEALPGADPRELDLILVPGSVFDRRGGRLGYGAGYYDRFLTHCRDDTVRLAPHFALQLKAWIYQGRYDQRMHILLNEEEIICINNSDAGKIN